MTYLRFITNNLPANSNGAANGPVVRIRPGYEDDRGLLEHELTHVKQWWRTLGLHSILYLCSKRYRLKAEVEAYREQLKYPPATNDPDWYRAKYAAFICGRYDLVTYVSQEEALALLS